MPLFTYAATTEDGPSPRAGDCSSEKPPSMTATWTMARIPAMRQRRGAGESGADTRCPYQRERSDAPDGAAGAFPVGRAPAPIGVGNSSRSHPVALCGHERDREDEPREDDCEPRLGGGVGLPPDDRGGHQFGRGHRDGDAEQDGGEPASAHEEPPGGPQVAT